MTDTINWDRLADRLLGIQRDMMHEKYSGNDFHAEALRRAFHFTPAGEPNDVRRVLPYDQIRVSGLTTQAQADHTRDGHTVMDRLNREAAEKQVREMRAEMARVYLEARKDVAEAIRSRCNERTVPAKFRREGVLLAADWIDPAVPKDQYGNITHAEESAA